MAGDPPTIDALVQELMAGTPLPAKPSGFEGEYVFPNVVMLTDDELGVWISNVGAFRSYANAMAAIYMTAELVAESNLERREYELRRDCDDGKKTQRAIREEVAIMPKISKDRESLLKIQAYSLFYTRVLKVYDAEFEVLSRELTRRRFVGGDNG